MGTRSMTIIMEGNQELCRIYRQYDGYPEGHGLELAKLCDVQIVNGYIHEMKNGGFANGMGNLAMQVVASLCQGIEQFHLEATGSEIGSWIEFVYVVRGSEGVAPTIECSTKTGPFPNIQSKDGHVFTGTSKEWLTKYTKG